MPTEEGSNPPWSILTEISTNNEGGAALTCARLILKTKKDDGSTPPWSLLPDISTDDEKRRQHSLAEPADSYIYRRRRRRSAFMRPLNTENDKGRRQHSSADPSYQNIDQQRRRRGAICTLLKLKTTKDDGSTPPWSLLHDISTEDEGDTGAKYRPTTKSARR